MYASRPSLTVLTDSRISRGNKWPNLKLKRQNCNLERGSPTFWPLSTGEEVRNEHTPLPVHLSREQFGNMQKVIKTNSAKGSLAQVRINQRCPPICYSVSPEIPGSPLWRGKKVAEKSQNSSLFISNTISAWKTHQNWMKLVPLREFSKRGKHNTQG